MKKFFYILALGLSVVPASLKTNEVDDLFDESPAVRLDNALKSYTEFFQKDGGKWLMQYFANGDEEGICFVMTFKSDGSVKISSRNVFYDPNGMETIFRQDESLWQVVSDYGPVLSFNTYNNAFHEFSSPQSDGTGHGGDYEFIIINAEDNTAKLRGKKTGIDIIMTRLDNNVDDEAYFADIYSAWSQFSENYPYIIMTSASGLKYICQGHSNMIWDFYPETGNPIDNIEHMNAVVTATGLRFMEPLDFMTEYEPDQVAAQNFERQPDGSYLCVEDGKTRISAPNLAYVFMQFNTVRSIPDADMTGDFATVFEQMKTETANNTNFKQIKLFQFKYNKTVEAEDGSKRYRYDLYFETNRRKGSMRMFIDKVDDNTVKFSFDPEAADAFDTNNAKNFYNLSTVKQFVALFTQGEYKISAESTLNPNPMVLTNTTNSGNSIKITF